MIAALFGRDQYPLVAKVYVYVDGFDLYYGALKRTPYKWLDLAALCRLMLPNDSIEQIKYYTARVSARPRNPSAPIDQQAYLRALRTIPNLTITFGHFLTHSVPMMLTGVTPVKRFGSTKPRKRVRTSISRHIWSATPFKIVSKWLSILRTIPISRNPCALCARNSGYRWGFSTPTRRTAQFSSNWRRSLREFAKPIW